MPKISVGITGQIGFIGTHLYNTLGLYPEEFTRIPFDDNYFDDNNKMMEFVISCNVIVHLAALNRHNDQQVIYETNISLVKKLINACNETGSKPYILFSSSTQEERDNPYGQSKKAGRELFIKWATTNGAWFTGLIIPNVFGPFGNPYYNSVVATFCHQLTHNETPKIEVDGKLKLIFVGELVKVIVDQIKHWNQNKSDDKRIKSLQVNHTSEITVSGLLAKLTEFRDKYFTSGIIPDLNMVFDRNLFNTFLCYIDHKSFFPFLLVKHTDNRGSFVETIKLNNGGQVSFSTTAPGITRGNHFHTRKAERFAVIKGKARIEIRKIGTDNKLSFELDGNQPSFVDMPVWHTHNITNTGEEELYTIFWINEFYDPNDPDTFFETV